MTTQPALFTTTGHEAHAAEAIASRRSASTRAKHGDLARFFRAGSFALLRELEHSMVSARDVMHDERYDDAIAILTDAQAELADAIALIRDYMKAGA